MVHIRTSMVVEWIGIHLPVQESLVPSLVQKIPQSNLAPTLHLLSPTHQEPMLHNREAPAMRGPRTAAREKPLLATTRVSLCTASKTQHSPRHKNTFVSY